MLYFDILWPSRYIQKKGGWKTLQTHHVFRVPDLIFTSLVESWYMCDAKFHPVSVGISWWSAWTWQHVDVDARYRGLQIECLRFRPFEDTAPYKEWMLKMNWSLRKTGFIYTYAGWWWLEHESILFPFSWECHHPTWRTHIFQRARLKPPTRSPIYKYL